MDKLGVVTKAGSNKTASSDDRCPDCGSKDINTTGSVPQCRHCGTKPWETARGR